MHNDKDIGTYFLRVELENGEGWIETWNTGWRYTDGTAGVTKLDATPIPPTWDNERDLFEAMEYMLTEGNSSCDCNKRLSLARAKHEDDSRDFECATR